MQITAATSSPSWGALVIAVVVVIVSHWLLPRVVFPRLANRRARPSLTEDPNPRRWAITAGAGLFTYLAAGLILGVPAPALLVWGIAFAALMVVMYRRTVR